MKISQVRLTSFSKAIIIKHKLEYIARDITVLDDFQTVLDHSQQGAYMEIRS